jgi:hypothetical protein
LTQTNPDESAVAGAFELSRWRGGRCYIGGPSAF